MGCDIHLYVEVQDESGKWHYLPRPEDMFFDRYTGDPNAGKFNSQDFADYIYGIKKLPVPLPFNIEEFMDDDGKFDSLKWWHSGHPLKLANDRNYNTFAILANVRNGHGFAGCKTSDGFNPISDPLGVPEDATQEFKDIVNGWGQDGHDHSHHTLQQLLDFNWDQRAQKRGVVSLLSYVMWVHSGKKEAGTGPMSYSGDVIGKNVRKISEDEMAERAAKLLDQIDALAPEVLEFIAKSSNMRGAVQKLKKEGKEVDLDLTTPDGLDWYTTVKWVERYGVAAGGFEEKVIPWLQSLGMPTDKVRIVFLFDN